MKNYYSLKVILYILYDYYVIIFSGFRLVRSKVYTDNLKRCFYSNIQNYKTTHCGHIVYYFID